MTKLTSWLGYVEAVITLLFMASFPFWSMDQITAAVGRAGLVIDSSYSGGTLAFTLAREGYVIDVYKPVFPGLIAKNREGFVQLTLRPLSGLPKDLTTSVDYDGDGVADFEIKLTDCCDRDIKPHLTVIPRNPSVVAVQDAKTNVDAHILAEPVKDTIYIRVPLLASVQK